MEKLDALTPTIVLIVGTIINHVFKEDKELTIRDVMLMLSPTIPTVLPIIISIFKSFLTSFSEYLKTFSDGTKLDMLMEYMPSMNFTLWNKTVTKSEDVKKNNILLDDSISSIDVTVDIMFMQLLLSYIAKKNNNVHYDVDSEISMKINNSDELVETQIWKNIKIPYENMLLKIDNMELTFTDNDSELLLLGYSKKLLDDNKCKNYTRLTDFMDDMHTSKSAKDIINKFAVNARKHFGPTITFNPNSFEHKFVESIKSSCPNLDRIAFILELMLVDYFKTNIHIGGNTFASSLQQLSTKYKCVDICGTTIKTTELINTSSYGNMWNDISSLNTFKETTSALQNVPNGIAEWDKKLTSMINKPPGEMMGNNKSLTFYIGLEDEYAFDVDINKKFKEFIKLVRDSKLLHKTGEKIKIFNTKMEKKEMTHINPNPEYANYKEKKAILEKAEGEQKNLMTQELFHTPIPDETIITTTTKTMTTTTRGRERGRGRTDG